MLCGLFLFIARKDLVRERGERQTLQRERDALLERTLTGLSNATTAVETANAAVNGLRDAFISYSASRTSAGRG